MNGEKPTRRGFLQQCGFDCHQLLVRKTAEHARSNPAQHTTAEDSPPDPATERPRRRRQFALRSLFYVTTLVAIFFAFYGKAIRENPLLVFGALIVGIAMSVIQEVAVRGFECLLWWCFGEGKDRKRR